MKNVTKILSISAFGLIVLYCGKIWHSYKFFANRGIPTPPYRFFFGNFLDIRREKKFSKCIREWTRKYGKTYGYYQGHAAFLVTSDLDFINEVFIKQYHNFSAKKVLPLDREDDASKVMIINATKGRWKRMRNIMNPTFSSLKMKELSPMMQCCIDKLLKKIGENVEVGEDEVDIMKLFKKFTMDTIWNCGFGLDRNMQNSEMGDLYIKNSDDSLQQFADFSPLMYLATYFTEFRKYIVYAHLTYNYLVASLFGERFVDPLYWIREEVIEIVDARMNNLNRPENSTAAKKRDYLQLLIDARCDNASELDENFKLNFAQMHLSKKLSLDEIKMNLSIFLMAGSESTSIALATLVHVLTMLPEEQEKLVHEIDEHFPFDSSAEPNYDNIQKLDYLDMIVKEALRMWPIANPACTRRCVSKTVVNGVDIPAGLTVVVDVLSLHYDADIWGPVDPEQFYPLRFASKRAPLAYMAFGAGPRNCIGIKFAMLELKMALVKIYRLFETVPCEKTVGKLDFIEGVIGIFNHDVIVKFKRRLCKNE